MQHELKIFHHGKYGYDVALCSCKQFGVYQTTRALAEEKFVAHLDAVSAVTTNVHKPEVRRKAVEAACLEWLTSTAQI